METVKLYLLEHFGDIKATVVAKDINEAMTSFQAYVDGENVNQEFVQALELVDAGVGTADWNIVVYENYQPDSGQVVLTKDMISRVYEVFEFDFVMGRVYGSI